MAQFKVIDEGDSFFTIKDVPVFEMHVDRGFPCDESWMNAAIKSHETYKESGYRPTIIIGHNVRGKEKESVGFLDTLVLKGKRLYADLVRVPKGVKEKIVRNAYPSRSVEVLPKSKRILTLALLGGTTPHFALPQMAYEEDNGETHLFFRSPEMEITEEMKKEIYAQVGTAVAETLPTAFETFLKAEEDTVPYTDPETGAEYAIPAALAAKLAKGVGKVAKGAGRFAKKHPAVAAGTAGVAAGRVSKRKYAVEGYQVNDETGEVYLDGTPLGMIVTYEDMQEAGMDVPTAVKKPQKLPGVKAIDPQLEISEAAVGEGSGVEAGQKTAVPGPGPLVQPLNRDDSEQFSVDELAAENYDLHQRLERVETANALVTEGRRAEEYSKWLTEQKSAGVPVGDIEKTTEFMMTQTPVQVAEYKKLLLTQPKVAFGKAEDTMHFSKTNEEQATVIKEDYEQNKAIYQAMGVTDKDLKYAGHVRTNQAVGEIQST